MLLFLFFYYYYYFFFANTEGFIRFDHCRMMTWLNTTDAYIKSFYHSKRRCVAIIGTEMLNIPKTHVIVVMWWVRPIVNSCTLEKLQAESAGCSRTLSQYLMPHVTVMCVCAVLVGQYSTLYALLQSDCYQFAQCWWVEHALCSVSQLPKIRCSQYFSLVIPDGFRGWLVFVALCCSEKVHQDTYATYTSKDI